MKVEYIHKFYPPNCLKYLKIERNLFVTSQPYVIYILKAFLIAKVLKTWSLNTNRIVRVLETIRYP